MVKAPSKGYTRIVQNLIHFRTFCREKLFYNFSLLGHLLFLPSQFLSCSSPRTERLSFPFPHSFSDLQPSAFEQLSFTSPIFLIMADRFRNANGSGFFPPSSNTSTASLLSMPRGGATPQVNDSRMPNPLSSSSRSSSGHPVRFIFSHCVDFLKLITS